MKSQNLSTNELINFLIQKRPDLVKDMMKSDHNFDLTSLSPYHKEGTVWTHLMMVMNEADKRDIPYLAKVACLVHDLGKPISRFVKYEEKKVMFQGHDGASCYIMINFLLDLGLSTQEIIDLIVVVAKHQYLYPYFKNEQLLNKDDLNKIKMHFKNQKKPFEILLDLAECDNEGRISDKKRRGIKDYFFPVLEKIEESNTFSQEKLDFKISVGLTGCGKSTYAKTLKDYAIISRDRCAEELFGDYSKITKEQLYSTQVDALFFDKLNKTMKKDVNIFIDKTNLTKDSQRRIVSSVSSKKYNKSCMVFMKDFELIKKDVESRAKLTGKQIPYEALRKFLLLFMSPMYDMFDKIDYKIIKDGDY